MQQDKSSFDTIPSRCGCYDPRLIGVLCLTGGGVIIAANDYFEPLLGFSATDLSGRAWEELCDPADRLAARDWWRGLRRRESTSPLEIRLRHRDGGSRDVLIVGRWIEGAEPRCIFLVLDLSEHKAREERILAAERQRRDLLIREVHHRIKNNLQGIVGLLQNQALAHPELADHLKTPIRQISSIALLYDLRSRGEKDMIFLCDLARVAAQACREIAPVPVVMDVPRYCSIEVDDREAVAVALILNELLFNAIKHGPEREAKVTLCLRRAVDHAVVTVRNRCREQARVPDLERPETLGTGLQLVASLLPRDGSARLHVRREGDEMIAVLWLRPPTVRLLPADERADR